MEKHFFLLPPCAVVATTVAFQEKGYFSWPFLVFHIYFKIPIASLTLEKGALPWPAPFAALFVNYLQKTQHSWHCRRSCGLVGLE